MGSPAPQAALQPHPPLQVSQPQGAPGLHRHARLRPFCQSQGLRPRGLGVRAEPAPRLEMPWEGAWEAMGDGGGRGVGQKIVRIMGRSWGNHGKLWIEHGIHGGILGKSTVNDDEMMVKYS